MNWLCQWLIKRLGTVWLLGSGSHHDAHNAGRHLSETWPRPPPHRGTRTGQPSCCSSQRRGSWTWASPMKKRNLVAVLLRGDVSHCSKHNSMRLNEQMGESQKKDKHGGGGSTVYELLVVVCSGFPAEFSAFSETRKKHSRLINLCVDVCCTSTCGFNLGSHPSLALYRDFFMVENKSFHFMLDSTSNCFYATIAQ